MTFLLDSYRVYRPAPASGAPRPPPSPPPRVWGAAGLRPGEALGYRVVPRERARGQGEGHEMAEVKFGELRSVVEAVRQIVLDWDGFVSNVEALAREHDEYRQTADRLAWELGELRAAHERLGQDHDEVRGALGTPGESRGADAGARAARSAARRGAEGARGAPVEPPLPHTGARAARARARRHAPASRVGDARAAPRGRGARGDPPSVPRLRLIRLRGPASLRAPRRPPARRRRGPPATRCESGRAPGGCRRSSRSPRAAWSRG